MDCLWIDVTTFFGPGMNNFSRYNFARFAVALDNVFVYASRHNFSAVESFPVTGVAQHSRSCLPNTNVAFPVADPLEFGVEGGTELFQFVVPGGRFVGNFDCAGTFRSKTRGKQLGVAFVHGNHDGVHAIGGQWDDDGRKATEFHVRHGCGGLSCRSGTSCLLLIDGW